MIGCACWPGTSESICRVAKAEVSHAAAPAASAASAAVCCFSSRPGVISALQGTSEHEHEHEQDDECSRIPATRPWDEMWHALLTVTA